jgi:hypothetical protein
MTGVFLFRRGEMPSWRSPPPGEPLTVVVVARRREEYHVVAAVEGHELETPEAEHCPGLKRLRKSTHLELNGKVFVNMQQAPTWLVPSRANPSGQGHAATNSLVGLGTPPGPKSRQLACQVGVTNLARERGRERARARESE